MKVNDLRGLYFLTLIDMEGLRQVSLVCPKDVAQSIVVHTTGHSATQDLLPDTLARIIRKQTGLRLEILIYDLSDGDYSAKIVNSETLVEEPIRTSDAILYAVTADIPIYMERTLYLRQSVKPSREIGKMAIPYNALSRRMLEDELANAVKQENYELAKFLSDELKKRQSAGDFGKTELFSDFVEDDDSDEPEF